MALSEREQKVLAELEEQLSEDPRFASQMQMHVEKAQPGFSTRNIVLGIIIAMLGLGVLLAGVTIQQIWLGVAGFIVMAAGVFLTTVKKKTPNNSESSSGGTENKQQSQPAKTRSSFMTNLEDRWEQRRREQP